ncbi:7468_t:CDS:2, partial [Gigaspora rosea]
IEDEDQNFEYVPEVEDLSNLVEVSRVEDPFSDLTKCTTLLKLQLNPDASTALNTIDVSFTTGETISFKNSYPSTVLKSKLTLLRLYKRKEFPIPLPNPNNLPAIVYYDTTSSSSSEKPAPSPTIETLLDEKVPLDMNFDSVRKAAIDLPLLYAELDSGASSDSSVEWCGASYPTEKEKENFYENIYIREDKTREEIKKKNHFNIGEIERGQYDELQELLEQLQLSSYGRVKP